MAAGGDRLRVLGAQNSTDRKIEPERLGKAREHRLGAEDLAAGAESDQPRADIERGRSDHLAAAA
jgi:hypothetical protein